MAPLALENPPKLHSDALHDIEKLLVRRLIRSREELQYGLKLSLCVERKAEGSVEPMFQQDWRLGFSRIGFLGWLAVCVKCFAIHSELSTRPYPTGNALAKRQHNSCCFMSERG